MSKFTFDINLTNNNANKHPQFETYKNYQMRVGCPTSWIKTVGRDRYFVFLRFKN